MKRIADRQIQREDGDDPHAVPVESEESSGGPAPAVQSRPMRGLPKRRGPAAAPQAPAAGANPFAKVAAVMPPSVPLQPVPSPFANLEAPAPWPVSSGSVSTGSQPSWSGGQAVAPPAKPAPSAPSPKKDEAPSLDESKVDFFKSVRGLNWSMTKELVRVLNEASDCSNLGSALHAIDEQYSEHYKTISEKWAAAENAAKEQEREKETKDAMDPELAFGSVSATRPLLSTLGDAARKSTLDTKPEPPREPSWRNKVMTMETTPKSSSLQFPSFTAHSLLGNAFESNHENVRPTPKHIGQSMLPSFLGASREQNDAHRASAFQRQADAVEREAEVDAETKKVDEQAEADKANEVEVEAKEAEAKAKEAKDKADAEEKEAKDKAEAKAKADSKAKADADAQAKTDADAKAKADAEAKAKADADAKADAKAQADAAKPSAPPTFSLKPGGFSFAGQSTSSILQKSDVGESSAPPSSAPTFSIPATGFSFAGTSLAPKSTPTTSSPPAPATTASPSMPVTTSAPTAATPPVDTTKPIAFGSAARTPSSSFSASGPSSTSPHRFSFGNKPKGGSAFTNAAIGPAFANTSGVAAGGQFSFGSAPIAFGAEDRTTPESRPPPDHSS